MAKKLSTKLRELRRVVRLHTNWLLYQTLGESALSKAEVEELEKYGKLPMGNSLELLDKSYILGRLRAILKRSEYKKVSYEEAIDQKPSLSPLEELILEQARIKAGTALKNLAEEISDGVYTALAQSLGKAITETTIQEAVADETVLALEQKKSAQKMASDLASRLQDRGKRDWGRVARTELQRAKVAGQAQAIANKVDIYKHSKGVDSEVSVVPGPNCCEDCSNLYLEPNGSPRIFRLKDLIAAGSNADPGVQHTKRKGVHVHWKTTLPPLHPSCGCQLVYIPSGFGWSAGKLEMINKSLFESDLQKARSGVSGGLSSTVKPTGPASAKPSTLEKPGMPSVPGAAAPGNTAGPGRPPGSSSMGGKQAEYQACAFGGGTECEKYGGSGAKTHKVGGASFKAHQEAMARGAEPVLPEAKEQQQKAAEQSATQFNQQAHPHDVVIDHLKTGKISSQRRLTDEDNAGVNQSYKVTIQGNGSGIMKPPIDINGIAGKIIDLDKAGFEALDKDAQDYVKDNLFLAGLGTMPEGMSPHSEVGAYGISQGLGVGLVRPTTLRTQENAQGVNSVQQWGENQKTIRDVVNKEGSWTYRDLMKSVPEEHKESVHEQLSSIAVLNAVINDNDGHIGNLLFSEDHTTVSKIDAGAAFGTGMLGHRNTIVDMFQEVDKPLVIPTSLHSKMKSMSLEATMRSLEASGLPEWAKAQTYLRTKYISSLQETYGQIPPKALGRVKANNNGELSYDEGVYGDNAEQRGVLPHQKFDQWAKDWMETTAKDPDNPFHEDAKELLDMQPLRSGRMAVGKVESTPSMLSGYYSSIPAYSTKYGPGDLLGTKTLDESPQPVRTPPDLAAGSKEEESSFDTNAAVPSKMKKKEEESSFATNAAVPSKMKKKEEEESSFATNAAVPSKMRKSLSQNISVHEGLERLKSYGPQGLYLPLDTRKGKR